ncbi:MAG: hypothetical protein ACYCU0_14760 [Solirubrobacteraceae bacterium]
MRLDALTRAIESAAPSSFGEIALLYLAVTGAEGAELRDGPGDGGNDIQLWRLGSNPAPVAIQISVQRANWASKVRRDATRAREVYGTSQFIYLTSRRVQPVDSQKLADDLWSHNISLRVIDAQAIASVMFEAGKTTQLLKPLETVRKLFGAGFGSG